MSAPVQRCQPTTAPPSAQTVTAEEQRHEIIWLQAWCDGCQKHCHSDAREWCSDEAWGDCEECDRKPIKYVRADSVATLTSSLAAASARIEELEKALTWAMPLADLALDTHRLERIRCGHTMSFQKSNGQAWIGLYQDEWDTREKAFAALSQTEPTK